MVTDLVRLSMEVEMHSVFDVFLELHALIWMESHSNPASVVRCLRPVTKLPLFHRRSFCLAWSQFISTTLYYPKGKGRGEGGALAQARAFTHASHGPHEHSYTRVRSAVRTQTPHPRRSIEALSPPLHTHTHTHTHTKSHLWITLRGGGEDLHIVEAPSRGPPHPMGEVEMSVRRRLFVEAAISHVVTGLLGKVDSVL